jgi:hypothetical protein
VTSHDAHDSNYAATPRVSWWHYARPGLLVLVTAVSLYMLLPSLVAVFSSWRSLAELTWYWTALALLAEAGSFVCLWQLDRVSLHEKSWFVVGCTQLSGNAVGRLVPGGAATATAFSVGMLRRAGVQAGQAAAALAASTSLQVGTRLALPLLALPAILGGAPVDRSLATSAYLGAVVVVLLIGAGVLAFAFDRPLASAGRALQWVLNGTIRRRRKIAASAAVGLLRRHAGQQRPRRSRMLPGHRRLRPRKRPRRAELGHPARPTSKARLTPVRQAPGGRKREPRFEGLLR